MTARLCFGCLEVRPDVSIARIGKTHREILICENCLDCLPPYFRMTTRRFEQTFVKKRLTAWDSEQKEYLQGVREELEF